MNPPPGNNDGRLLSFLLKPMGCAKGQPNFRGDEDVMLALAYVIVMTSAAIGMDQNGATFWEKIRENFVQLGGNAGGNACSLLQNQFNKVLQMEVNKYTGMLMMPTVNREESKEVAVAPEEQAVPGMGMYTPHPSIEKKLARANEYNRKQQMTVQLVDVVDIVDNTEDCNIDEEDNKDHEDYNGHGCFPPSGSQGDTNQNIIVAECMLFFVLHMVKHFTFQGKFTSLYEKDHHYRKSIVGDNAYTCSEYIVLPFAGDQKHNPVKDTYYFYLSQLRIRFEMAFGILTSKWRILRRPLQGFVKYAGKIFLACIRLHNFIIDLEGGDVASSEVVTTVGFAVLDDSDNIDFLPSDVGMSSLCPRELDYL